VPGAFALNCPCCFRPGTPLCESPSLSLTPAQKLTAIRGLLRQKGVDAYLVPSEDAHGSEYVSECDMRRSYLTGFTGSAGTALVKLGIFTDLLTLSPFQCWVSLLPSWRHVWLRASKVTATGAWLWTDSRYFLQAAAQLNSDSWTLMRSFEPGVPAVQDFIGSSLGGKKVGVDPAVFDQAKAEDWRATWKTKAGPMPELVGVDGHLVDAMWPGRPPIPCNPIEPLHPDASLRRIWR